MQSGQVFQRNAAKIRECFNRLGWERPWQEIHAELLKIGITVSMQQITVQKSAHRKNPNYPSAIVDRLTRNLNGDTDTIENLKRVKAIKDKMGSFYETFQLFDKIEKIGSIEKAINLLAVLQALSK